MKIFAFFNFLLTSSSFPKQLTNRLQFSSKFSLSVVDDKAAVESYFNNIGFERWNKIYSDSGDVNSVQRDIRTGHQQTIDKVIGWVESEDNSMKALCDAGCGVGSLAIPMARLFGKVYASDISSSMVEEARRRATSQNLNNIQYEVSDMEKLTGTYNTITCIDVMIHYPTNKIENIISHLGSLAKDRIIISFAPKNLFYDILKKIGELFPGKSKTTRAYLHREEDVVNAMAKAGFTVTREEMTSTNFYFSRLLEGVRK